MRILTVRQPWAWAIIHGGKDVENRARNIAGAYRGPVAIHAGAAWDDSSYDNPGEWEVRRAITAEQNGWPAGDGEVWASDVLEPEDERYVRSAIIGAVNLWAVHQDRDNGNCCPHRPSGGPGGSPWSERDVWHLCLNDPHPLATPIPYRGALGLRRLPDHIIEEINHAR